MTSVERTAYPIFPKLVLARDLHVFFTPSPDEVVWAREKTDTDEHLLALTLALKCFQKMGRFLKASEVPESVVEHLRRCLELDERLRPVYVSAKTRDSHRVLVRRLGEVVHNPSKARKVAQKAIWDGVGEEPSAGPD